MILLSITRDLRTMKDFEKFANRADKCEHCSGIPAHGIDYKNRLFKGVLRGMRTCFFETKRL